jgi:fatty-acid peroxygenase
MKEAGTERAIPQITGFDKSMALLREGYAFIGRRCAEYQTDIFRTRLMLRPVICLRGAAAASLFYSGDHLTRVGGMPISVVTLLQDFGSVQMLDGEAHRHRKMMFVSLMSPASVDRLRVLFRKEWRAQMERVSSSQRIVLFDEVRPILCRAALAWAGITINPDDAQRRTIELSEMIETAGMVGLRNLRAQVLRHRCERWARMLVRKERLNSVLADPPSALSEVSRHRDSRGELLSEKTAAVELINVLRPTVAIARFIVFAAKALHEHASLRGSGTTHDCEHLDRFVDEVRRTAPFFPFVGARVRDDFRWEQYLLRKGEWLLFDLYGTNHLSALWEAPGAFRPEHFERGKPDVFSFVPQGGGRVDEGHRCPGEPVTVALMKDAILLMQNDMTYSVPPQDLSVSLSRMPALPHSGFEMTDIYLRDAGPIL